MKKVIKTMVCISILAFITVLFTYGVLCYELGASYLFHSDQPIKASEYENVVMIFIIPIFYLVLLVAALVLLHRDAALFKRPYIVMAVANFAPMALFWIFYVLYPLIDKTASIAPAELWYPIVMTVLTFAIAVCYIGIAVGIAGADRRRAKRESGITGPGKEIAG